MPKCRTIGCQSPRLSTLHVYCREHWNAYRRELRRRSKGVNTGICSVLSCGARLRLNQKGDKCAYHKFVDRRAQYGVERPARIARAAERAAATRQAEYVNPTRESTWLRIAKRRRHEVNRLLWLRSLPESSPSRREASTPAATSPGR